MDSVVKFLQPYQLHPVVDHFSVALLFTAVLIDLVAGSAPNRIWLRYTAVLLMILGALAGLYPAIRAARLAPAAALRSI